MEKIFLGLFSGIIICSAMFYAAGSVKAIDVQYPVAELGNCGNQIECQNYCNDLSHKDACLTFAQNNGLMSASDVQMAKSFPAIGPGNCKTDEDCKAYCDDATNAQECLTFAEKYKVMPQAEIDKAKDFLNSAGPGGCKDQQDCKKYCDQLSHQGECVDYATQKGVMTADQAQLAKKAQSGQTPGGCKTKQECESYCNDGTHSEECLNFAEANGLISSEDAARARKLGLGVGPGGCKGRECKAYCDDSSHVTECLDYAVQKGLMSPEDAKIAKKLGNTPGPGGCQKDDCKTYCDDPAHADNCLSFAEQNGLLSGEDLAQAKKFAQFTNEPGPGGCKGKDCKTYCDDPAHATECLGFAKDKGLVPAEDIQKMEASQKLAQTLKDKNGPGGCSTETECKSYCADSAHMDECIAYMSSTGVVSNDQAVQMLTELSKMKGAVPGSAAEIMQFKPGQTNTAMSQETQAQLEQLQQLEGKFSDGQVPSMGNQQGPPTQDEIDKIKEEMMKNVPSGTSQGNTQAPPTQEEIQKMIPKDIPEGTIPSTGIQGPPTQEQIQQMMPNNIPGGSGPSSSQGPPAGQGPPTAEQIQQMMQSGGAPPGGGQYGPPAGIPGR
jgi:hypothetical protein